MNSGELFIGWTVRDLLHSAVYIEQYTGAISGQIDALMIGRDICAGCIRDRIPIPAAAEKFEKLSK